MKRKPFVYKNIRSCNSCFSIMDLGSIRAYKAVSNRLTALRGTLHWLRAFLVPRLWSFTAAYSDGNAGPQAPVHSGFLTPNCFWSVYVCVCVFLSLSGGKPLCNGGWCLAVCRLRHPPPSLKLCFPFFHLIIFQLQLAEVVHLPKLSSQIN